MQQEFNKSRRWVIKVGTSSLVTAEGHFSTHQLESLVSQVVALLHRKIQVVLVSSGAIALGMDTLKLAKRPHSLPELQACAAIGQGKLMRAYETAFSNRGLHSAQLLLTQDCFQDRKRYVNAKNTVEALLRMGSVPVVNENDTVATEEIKFGDNDVLAAQVADLVGADLLILLSDIDGLYLKDKTIIRHIRSSAELKECAEHIHAKRSEKTKGGMETKLQAAQMAMRSGIPVVLANGRDEHVIDRALKGEEVGSLFHPTSEKMNARKKWLAHATSTKGRLIVDTGARQALVNGKRSLLASGVVACSGNFRLGDPVEVVDESGVVFARGLVNYSREEVEKIKGCKTGMIHSILGYKRCDELLHRNNMVFLVPHHFKERF
ncbi:MAG: glutamate 5-kinase [Omnitrophica bacterium RIFCSPLOWO2_12_FULL_50_11]|nr:MAG: glutamate 5-kinase [Omnitrophica bacterium RIFCSPLOWO2_12_FULL_50_11]